LIAPPHAEVKRLNRPYPGWQAAALLMALLTTTTAWGQAGVPPAAPPAAEPTVVKPAAPGRPPATPATPTTPRFDIFAFNVTGNSVLSAGEIETAIYPFLGEDKSIADAERARAALERAYQARGFLSVSVLLPPQAIDKAELQLRVVEAAIGSRRITGAQYNLPSLIAAATPSLAPGTVPDFNALQADLAQVQTGADLQITPVLVAALDAGKLDVELKVQDQLALHGSVELNSKQTFNGQRGKLEAGLHYDNLFQRQQSLGLTWLVPVRGTERGSTWVLSHGAAMAGGRLSTTFVTSDSSTPTSLGGATVTNGQTLGTRWRQPVGGAGPGFSHGWSLGLDVKNNRDGNQNVAGSSTQNPDLRYPVVSIGYDLYSSGSTGSQTSFDVSLSSGLSGVGSRVVDCNGRSIDQFACKRAGASAGFQVLRMNLQTRQAVFNGWEAGLKLQVQLAGDPLVSSEQIGAGGIDSVRGYYEFEQVGDQGLVLRSELSSPPLATLGPFALTGMVFGDLARLRVNQPLPAEQADIKMGSLGFGLRGQTSDGLQLRLDVSLPLVDTLKADSNGQKMPASGRDSPNSRRIDLSARYAF